MANNSIAADQASEVNGGAFAPERSRRLCIGNSGTLHASERPGFGDERVSDDPEDASFRDDHV